MTMKKLWIWILGVGICCVAAILVFLIFHNGNDATNKAEKMTMDAVLELAEQESVSWEDLEKYEFEIIGSGISYNRYDLDEEYYVLASAITSAPDLSLYNTRLQTSIRINENADAVRTFIASRGAYCEAEVEDAIYDELSEYFYSHREPMEGIVNEAKAWGVEGNTSVPLLDIQYDMTGVYDRFGRKYALFVYDAQVFSIPGSEKLSKKEREYLNALNANTELKAGLSLLTESEERICVDLREDTLEVLFEIDSAALLSVTEEKDSLYGKYYVVYSERELAEQSLYQPIEEHWYIFVYE